MVVHRIYETGMDELTARKDFNDELEFSMDARGIPAEDSGRRGLMTLQDRDPEKFSYLIGVRDLKTGVIKPTPILEMIHPRAREAMGLRTGKLMVKANKLRLDQQEVTPALLADELGISLSTLYQRFGRTSVKRACQRELPLTRCREKRDTKLSYYLFR